MALRKAGVAVVDVTARGLLDYGVSLALQDALVRLRGAGAVPDTVLLVQHAPVYTIGKRGSAADFRNGTEAARAAGATIVTVPRGGETTYHGPGQLVAYLAVDLRARRLGARRYVEGLEDAMVAVAGAYGVAARGRVPGRPGTWVGDRKLGAVGVRIGQGGITSHGLALNVDTDLAAFGAIVPCGAPDKLATSLAAEVRAPAPLGLAVPGRLLVDALSRGLFSFSPKLAGAVGVVAVAGGDNTAHTAAAVANNPFLREEEEQLTSNNQSVVWHPKPSDLSQALADFEDPEFYK